MTVETSAPLLVGGVSPNRAPSRHDLMNAGEGSAEPNQSDQSHDRPFTTLYREHYDAAHRWARALGASSMEAEDVVQEAFVVAFRRRAEIDRERSFRAWLFQVLRRVLAHERRARARRLRRESQRQPGPAVPDPEQAAELRETLDFVEAFMRRLPSVQREVFALCSVEGLSVPEAAAVLDAAVPTTRARWRNAKNKFARAVARRERRTHSDQRRLREGAPKA